MYYSQYRHAIDTSILKAQARGYRIQDKDLFNPYKRTCCPIGATMAFNRIQLNRQFSIVFMAAFDGGIHPLVNASPCNLTSEAHLMGQEYRRKFIHD